ncbi:SAF domain-containing protein [Paenibacillus sp. GCM10012307]|uniref:SAF domain-containing protein n=1 Tax=Paenibacillus roseus TaxID=2798579 RepID=A0A934MNZ4_9BACL|nr:SAF domain-containing protein [Paenibacillus roseus]MBJ6361526.1 SAF domain-containing protein [Paenibacillus roseus]
MNRKRNVLIGLIAAALSALLVYGMYQLQVRQIDLQETVEVIVPSRFIATGERITGDMLSVKKMTKASYGEEMIIDPALVIGRETAVPLGLGEPVLGWKISPYRLLPARDQATFQIPKGYILSVSNGIRAGDRVIVYLSGQEQGSLRLFRELVTVASVKNSGNQEVDDLNKSNMMSMANGNVEGMYASRRDANAMIDYINLNLTEEQWLEIDRLCNSGDAKLVIAFSPLSLELTDMKGKEAVQ